MIMSPLDVAAHRAIPPSRVWDQVSMRDDSVRVMARLLEAFPTREREAVIRFYVQEESAEEIERDLGLTAHEFRRIKSRIRKRFAELTAELVAPVECA